MQPSPPGRTRRERVVVHRHTATCRGIINTTNSGSAAQTASRLASSVRTARMQTNPIPTLTPRQEENFWNKVDVVPGCCWEWQGCRLPTGYGRVGIGNRGFYAHRVAFVLLTRQSIDGVEIDHLCRNRRCVNPDHLEPVTHQVNQLRGYGAYSPKRKRPNKEFCIRGHLRNSENLNTSGNCRSCARIRERNRYRRLRERSLI